LAPEYDAPCPALLQHHLAAWLHCAQNQLQEYPKPAGQLGQVPESVMRAGDLLWPGLWPQCTAVRLTDQVETVGGSELLLLLVVLVVLQVLPGAPKLSALLQLPASSAPPEALFLALRLWHNLPQHCLQVSPACCL
jgi:hypothetical protein